MAKAKDESPARDCPELPPKGRKVTAELQHMPSATTKTITGIQRMNSPIPSEQGSVRHKVVLNLR